MATPELELLQRMVAQLVRRSGLTPDERREVFHIARCISPREAARAERVPVEKIRTRRKIVYRKLRLSGASALISALLGLSLEKLAGPSSDAESGG